MLKLTCLVDGSDFSVDPARKVERYVYVVPDEVAATETLEMGGGCCIVSREGKNIAIVKESAEEVARMVVEAARDRGEGGGAMLKLVGESERPVYLCVDKIVSVEPVESPHVSYKCSIRLLSGWVGVKEPAEEVAALIAKAEGVAP